MANFFNKISKACSAVSTRTSLLTNSSKNGLSGRNYSQELNETLKKHLKLAFIQADKDKDGRVSADEMKQAVKLSLFAKGIQENATTVNNVLEQIIFQDKKTLSQDELLKRANQLINFFAGLHKDILRQKFAHVDKDRDGRLTKEEAGRLLDELYPLARRDRLDHLMSNYDQDRDGKISLKEVEEFARKELIRQLS